MGWDRTGLQHDINGAGVGRSGYENSHCSIFLASCEWCGMVVVYANCVSAIRASITHLSLIIHFPVPDSS